MACYIVDQAKEVREDTHSASASESEESEGHSEDELSDVIPFQDKRKATALDYSESDSGQSRRDNKENRGHSSSTTSAKVARKKKRKRAQAQSPCDRDILSELKKTNQLMQNLSKKMKRHDTRLQAIENKLQESTMSSNSSVTPKRPVKKEVPCEVRRETRRVYNLLLEDSESDFQGWMIEPGKTFKDPHNQSVLNVLIQEVKGLNPAFLTQHIRDAAYRFYRSRNEDLSSKRRGTFDMKSKSKRLHERLVRKLQERKKLFEAGSYKDNDEKAKWRTIMTMDFMSSDQSGVDDGNEVLLSKPLPWESPSVTLFKKTLDDAALQQKSPLAKRQMKPRKRGMPSTRSKPSADYPDWAYQEY